MRYLIIPLLLLSGCAMTPEQQAKAIFDHYGPLCENIGYTKGTEKYGDCVVRQYQADVQIQQARSAQMGAMGMYFLNQAKPRPMVNTTCSRLGNFVNCTSQ